MSTAQTLILGAIAGFLIFLLWDVLSHAVGPVEEVMEEHEWGEFAGYVPLLAGGFIVGLMGLVYYDAWIKRRRQRALLGPGAASEAEFTRVRSIAHLSPARTLALFIATGIGLHNFGEGLAIGQASAADEISLALVLIIGFALHNATEGFGIIGPMSGEAERPSWSFLWLMGLIGGGPTFLGTVIGQAWVSEALQVAFFAVAAGSILYVVIQLFEVCRRYAMPTVVAWWILAGITAGFATDFVLVAAGA